MAKNNAKFAIDLNKYIKVVDSQGNKEMRGAGLFALKGVMRKTPVDNGTARGNWNAGINSIDTMTRDDITNYANYGSYDRVAFQNGSGVIDGFKNGDTINISNSMPYINRLEFTDHSTQGSGMVRRTEKELIDKLKSRNKKV